MVGRVSEIKDKYVKRVCNRLKLRKGTCRYRNEYGEKGIMCSDIFNCMDRVDALKNIEEK